MTFIDTHCHLQFEAFENDAASAIDRAKKAGCEALIVVGAMLDSSEKAVAFAQIHDGLFASVGIHPHHADKVSVDDVNTLEPLAKQEKVVAIGEIGLDYHPYESNGMVDKEVQKRLLLAQFSLARRLSLPIIIHCRDAWTDLFPLVAQYIEAGGKPGVFHCWSGNKDDAQRALDLGFFISFAGNLTYSPRRSLGEGGSDSSSTIQTVAKTIPLDRILLETDSPYLAPQPIRGTRNEPAFIIHTAEFIARLRGTSVEAVAHTTTANAKRVFGLD
ncbi:MAG: TatD family hydrolase [bacterium]|nr:TatD family hydrolase [bacterium]